MTSPFLVLRYRGHSNDPSMSSANTRTISETQKSLNTIISNDIRHSVFLWGAPGIGKSSIVHKVAKDNKMDLIDLRISQLAPTDIRGLPHVEDGMAKFAPPSYLPHTGRGILFVDEFNMASPSMMGIAQQLILDRQVGDYKVPDGWYIVAAGNRVEDRAAVSQMPAPVANRFIHFYVEPNLDSWKAFAISSGVSDQIISFLNFRPQLLFNFNKSAQAWPSPRSWEFASDLLKIGESIDAAVGEGTSAEFYSYQAVYSKLPDVDLILNGGNEVSMPKEPSLMYAICGALVAKSKTPENFFNGLKWLINQSTEDYTCLYLGDATLAMRAKNPPIMGEFVRLFQHDTQVGKFLKKFQQLSQKF